MNIISSIVLPTFILIVLPIILFTIVAIFVWYIPQPIDTQLLAVGGLLAVAILFTILAYLIYPPYSTEKYFKKKSPENIVMEYEFIKKIMYVLSPWIILGIALLVVEQFIALSIPGPILGIFAVTILVATLSVGSALIKILLLTVRKEFQLYFAKSCFHILSKKEDEVEKIKYLKKGLNAYNKYLARQLGLQITGLRQIYSTISSSPAEEQNKLIELISKAFERDNKLEPLVCLSKFMKVPEGEQFLTKEPLFKKIEEWGSFGTALSGITAAPVAVITLLPNVKTLLTLS
jgi:hypothetical protein